MKVTGQYYSSPPSGVTISLDYWEAQRLLGKLQTYPNGVVTRALTAELLRLHVVGDYLAKRPRQ